MSSRSAWLKSLAPLALLFPCAAHATWSVILLDAETHEIGIAAASCSEFVGGIESISPGKGAVVAQAASNMKAKAKASQLISAGRSPADIVAAITDAAFDKDAAKRQYAVLTFDALDAPASFTGDETPDYHGIRIGKGFSIQGNTLASAQVLDATASVIDKRGEHANESLADSLMRAWEAGTAAGGDKRCGPQHATSAFITVVKPDMDWWEPYLDLHVHHVPRGQQSAVTLLRRLYVRWEKEYGVNRSVTWSVAPPPTVPHSRR